MKLRPSLLATAGLWVVAATLELAAQDLPGHQFVFFDDVLIADEAGLPALHRRGPSDLSAPVDYTQGRLYLRLEILEKPSDLPMRFAYFIWQRLEGGLGHMGVGRHELADITEEGVYYVDCGGPETWWHGKYPIPDWTRPFDEMALVPWVGNTGEKLATIDCYSHCFSDGDIAAHLPMVMRATGIWVAPGKQLVPPSDWDCPQEWDTAPGDETVPATVRNPARTGNELLLLDEVFTHQNSTEGNKKMGFSEFPPPDHVPSDWTAPIPYNEGTVHYRVSILTKPTEAPIHYQMGFQWDGGCSGHYYKEKFPRNNAMRIVSPGIYTWEQDIPSFWEQSCQEDDPIDWTTRMKRMLVVVWNDRPRVVDDRWGYAWDGMRLEDYYPMSVHFQAVLVPPGEPFGGWDHYTITPPLAGSAQD